MGASHAWLLYSISSPLCVALQFYSLMQFNFVCGATVSFATVSFHYSISSTLCVALQFPSLQFHSCVWCYSFLCSCNSTSCGAAVSFATVSLLCVWRYSFLCYSFILVCGATVSFAHATQLRVWRYSFLPTQAIQFRLQASSCSIGDAALLRPAPLGMQRCLLMIAELQSVGLQ